MMPGKVWTDGNCGECDRCITSVKVLPCNFCENEDTVECDNCGQFDECKFKFKKN